MKFLDFDFNNKTILVTGGAGFIGSNIALYIQKNYPFSRIVIFDCFRSGKKFENGNLISFGHYKNIIEFQGDIVCGNIAKLSDLEKLEAYKFDVIFHQAAISDTRVYDQEIVMKTNVNSFYWFLEKTRKDNSVLIYASSAATYGSCKPPQRIGIEDPENPYGYSKLMMDMIAKSFAINNPDLTIVGLRFFNVYGPNEFYKAKTSSMIIQLAHQLLEGKEPRLFENSENIFRDFVYIDDVVQANIRSVLSSKSGVYNVGSGIARSFREVTDILQFELGTSLPITYITNPYTGYQNFTQADISLSKEAINYSPMFSLEKGIKAYLPYIKKTFQHDFY